MKFLIDQIVRPTSHRLATSAGAFLTGLGYASDTVNVVVAAIPVVIGLLVDLIVRKVL